MPVIQVHDDGSESVFVDTQQYASDKVKRLSNSTSSGSKSGSQKTQFPWSNAYMNEGYILDGWIRLLRLRPMLKCGLQSATHTVNTSTVHPMYQELTGVYHGGTAAHLRVASSLPHEGQSDPLKEKHKHQVESINFLKEHQTIPSSKAAAAAGRQQGRRSRSKPAASWPAAAQHETEFDSGPSVPESLACQVCKKNTDDSKMLVCSGCVNGFHYYCLDLKGIPDGKDWFCPDCSDYMQPASSPAKLSTSSDYQPSDDDESCDGEPCDGVAEQPDEDDHVPILPLIDSPGHHNGHGLPTAQLDSTGQDIDEEDNTSWPSAEEEAQEEEEEEEEEDEGDQGLVEIFDDIHVLHYLQHDRIDEDNLKGDNRGQLNREIRRIMKRAKNYRWDATTGRLMRRPTKRYPHEREVPPPNVRQELLTEIHEDYGHLGQKKILSIVQQRYCWRGVAAQVREVLKDCDICMRNRTPFRMETELQPIPPSTILSRVHVDSMGPHPKTPRATGIY